MSPIILQGRKIFQECCIIKLDWDCELPLELLSSWHKFVNSIKSLNFSIPRCLRSDVNCNSIELHTFVDGSETGYGSVSYLRFLFNHHVDISFVASKSRLTPLNNSILKTIPRIELCAALLGVDLSLKICEELSFDVNKHYFWCDSSTVLRYVKNDSRRYLRFVDNKVSFIRNYSNAGDWYYVPSHINPADLVRRGCTGEALTASHLWRNGPTFLNSYDKFPDQTFDLNFTNECEVKAEAFTLHARVTEETEDLIDSLINSVSDFYVLRKKICVDTES